MYMLRVKMIFLILIFLLGGLWETEAVSVTGVVGEEVKIKCSHSNAFNNVKYFCKGPCKSEDILVKSRTNKDSNEKYSITDEGNTFYVTISRLTADDSGTYRCGIDRAGLDTYNEVVLAVIEGNTQDPDNDSQSNSNKLVYIGAGLGVLVLALAMVLLIFFRHRNRGIHTFSGKNHDPVNATVSCQKQDGHHITTPSSTANEYRETDSRTNSISSTVQHQDFGGDRSDNIYSNVSVSSGSQIQPDGLLYTTVSFNKHTDGSADTPGTAELTYSAINHDAADESAVYDNVRTQL
ncbi:uncharacterized protein LOC116393001 [Anarrhichthys ocellatus]|uniref:uncharacterized protein LOC116393001 n=1 Tax=Anarrhichthys ocellatus TaxID=433405 RepID=UPI0012ED10FE|nr:uncharacterized protein LOC116393001 [Anarrhichthys ocellatus]